MWILPAGAFALRLRPLTDADLRRHDLGRGGREVSLALRERLGALDGERCRMPGCTRHKKLHPHHVRLRSDGGPTTSGTSSMHEHPLARARLYNRRHATS